MMKFLKIFFLSVCLMASLIPPCFAASEPSESEGSEVVQSSQLALAAGDQMPTVNVSDESIAAIADAISSSGPSYNYGETFIFPSNDGVVYSVDTSTQLMDGGYVVAVVGETARLVFGEIPFYDMIDKDPNTGKLLISYPVYEAVFSDVNLSVEDLYSVAVPNYAAEYDAIIWASESLYDAVTGELIYQNTFEPIVYCSVNFSTGYSGYYIPGFSVKKGETVSDFPVASYEGVFFDGWYLDSEFSQKVSGPLVISSDTVLYAKWIETPAMVIFHNTISESLSAMLNCEPMIYMLSLFGLVAIIGVGRIFVKTRL